MLAGSCAVYSETGYLNKAGEVYQRLRNAQAQS
jgi:hypothetical protein